MKKIFFDIIYPLAALFLICGIIIQYFVYHIEPTNFDLFVILITIIPLYNKINSNDKREN